VDDEMISVTLATAMIPSPGRSAPTLAILYFRSSQSKPLSSRLNRIDVTIGK
jgi:hypothetical protein